MAKLTLGAALDVNKNELLKVVIENLSTHPTASPREGQIYYNTTDDTVYVNIGGSNWLDLGYQHPDNFTAHNLDLSANKATVLAAIETNTEGHVVAASTRIMTLADLGFTGDSDAINYVHPTDGVDFGAEVTGTTIISDVEVNAAGHVTGFKTRDLNNSDLGSLIIQDALTNGTHTWSSTKIKNELDIIDSKITGLDNKVAGALIYKGVYNASTNTPNLKTAVAGALDIGFTYVVSVAGTFDGQEVDPGDMIIIENNSPYDFNVVNKNIPNIPFATESVAGLIKIASQAMITAGTDNTTAVSPLGLKQRLDAFFGSQRYSQDIGDGSVKDFTISNATHKLGTGEDFAVTVREKATNSTWLTEYQVNTTTGAVTIKFNNAPTTNQFRIKIYK